MYYRSFYKTKTGESQNSDFAKRAQYDEERSVRSDKTDERICQCKEPKDAEFVAMQLNKANNATKENLSGVVIEWLQSCGIDYDNSDIESLENMIERKLKRIA